MQYLIIVFIIMSVFPTCDKNKADIEEGSPLAAAQHLNVPYGGDSAQKMDVYLPAGRSPERTKSIVLVHGGSWNAGNKSDLNGYIDTFKKRLPEYAIFNLNYRLVSANNRFPVQEEDLAAAVEMIADSAESYGINQNSLVLVGISAGAHLALLHAYKHPQPVAIKAVVDFFGPSDLVRMYHQPWHPLIPYLMEMVTGKSGEEHLQLLKESSPIQFIKPQAPPTLILHGSRDQIVAVAQSEALKKSLDAAGVPAELVVYQGEAHGWFGKNLVHSFDKIQAFLEQHVPGSVGNR